MSALEAKRASGADPARASGPLMTPTGLWRSKFAVMHNVPLI